MCYGLCAPCSALTGTSAPLRASIRPVFQRRRRAFATLQRGAGGHASHLLTSGVRAPQIWTLLDAMDAVAKELGKSVAQVAIRWVLEQPGVSCVVIGAKVCPCAAAHLSSVGSLLPVVPQRLSQLEANCAAGSGWSLSEAHLGALADASAIPIPYPYEVR